MKGRSNSVCQLMNVPTIRVVASLFHSYQAHKFHSANQPLEHWRYLQKRIHRKKAEPVIELRMCRTTTVECVDPSSLHPPTATEQAKNVRQSRHVSFHEVLSEAAVASLNSLEEEEKDQIWYRSEDIEGFRTDARNLCRELRRRPLRPGESVRGLEFRTDLARQKRKYITIKCVVRAQKRYSDPRQLARIYRKCSAWSAMAASAVADNDFYNAYDLAFQCDIPTMAEFPLPFRSRGSSTCSKRSSVDSVSARPSLVEGHRRVRRRTEAVV